MITRRYGTGRGVPGPCPGAPAWPAAGGGAGAARVMPATVVRTRGWRKRGTRRQRLAAPPARAAAVRAHGRMTAVDRTRLAGRPRLRMPFRIGVVAGLLAVAACGAGAGTAPVAGQASGGQ